MTHTTCGSTTGANGSSHAKQRWAAVAVIRQYALTPRSCGTCGDATRTISLPKNRTGQRCSSCTDFVTKSFGRAAGALISISHRQKMPLAKPQVTDATPEERTG